MSLPSPATGTELYLAAILDELRALRVAVEGGRSGAVSRQIDEALGEVADQMRYAPTEIVAGTTADPSLKPPTRRTRARAPR